MKKVAFGIVTAAFAVAAVAQNASPPARSDTATAPVVPPVVSAPFTAVDQNKDGRISQAEALSHGSALGTAFIKLDANSDTYLSQAEYGKWGTMSHEGHPDAKTPDDSGKSSTRTPGAGGQ